MGRVEAPEGCTTACNPLRCTSGCRIRVFPGCFRPRGVLPWGRRWGVVGGGRRGRWEVVGGGGRRVRRRRWEIVGGPRARRSRQIGSPHSDPGGRLPPGDERQFTGRGCRSNATLRRRAAAPGDERQFTGSGCRSNATLRRRAAAPSDERQFTGSGCRSNAMVLRSAGADEDRWLAPARPDGWRRRGPSVGAGEDRRSARAPARTDSPLAQTTTLAGVVVSGSAAAECRVGAGRSGQLEDEPGAAVRWRGGDPAAVAFGDAGRDREPATARSPSRPGPADELGDRRREAAAAVDDLDPERPAVTAPADADLPSPVLDRVRDQIARCLGEPHPVAPGRAPSARPLDLEPTFARVRVRARGLDALRQQPRDVDRRPVLGVPPPPGRRFRGRPGRAPRGSIRDRPRAGSRLTVRRRATRARSRAAPR